MSILHYLASSTPLPEGNIITQPDIIYPNYQIYKKSIDFVMPKAVRMTSSFKFNTKFYNTDHPVYVYTCEKDFSVICFDKYDKNDWRTMRPAPNGTDEWAPDEWDRFMQKQDVSKHFNLPYIYYLGIAYSRKFLLEILCSILNPQDQVEEYACWGVSESAPRDRQWDQIADLQAFIDKGDICYPITDYARENHKYFVRYIAPREKLHDSNFIPWTTAIIIKKDIGEERIPNMLIEDVNKE